jgi:predicted nucleic acid-binding protein
MYTIDASVHVSAVNPSETDSVDSQAFLVWVRQRQLPLFCPTLLLTEVAAAIARALGNIDRAISLAGALRRWSGQTLVPLDETLSDRSVHLAATMRLRGADAVYAAVAQQYGTTLVTLDRQQLERLPPALKVLRPSEALREAQKNV